MRLHRYGDCKGITKQGKPCGAVDIFANGFCKHHGGTGKLRRDLALKERISKAIRKSDAWKKRHDAFMRRFYKQHPELKKLHEERKARRDGRKAENAARQDLRGDEPQGSTVPAQAAL